MLFKLQVPHIYCRQCSGHPLLLPAQHLLPFDLKSCFFIIPSGAPLYFFVSHSRFSLAASFLPTWSLVFVWASHILQFCSMYLPIAILYRIVSGIPEFSYWCHCKVVQASSTVFHSTDSFLRAQNLFLSSMVNLAFTSGSRNLPTLNFPTYLLICFSLDWGPRFLQVIYGYASVFFQSLVGVVHKGYPCLHLLRLLEHNTVLYLALKNWSWIMLWFPFEQNISLILANENCYSITVPAVVSARIMLPFDANFRPLPVQLHSAMPRTSNLCLFISTNSCAVLETL